MSEGAEVHVQSTGGAILAGTLTLPAGLAKCPALVGVHGASMGTRDADLVRHLQALLPEHGVATLCSDRRGQGASTGEPRAAGFEDLAADVRAWVSYLRRHRRIDGDRIGRWCISQGGWIAALVAAADPAIAYLIAVSPSGLTAAEQMKYAAACLLREADYPEPVVTGVMAIRERIDAYFRGQTGLEEARALVDGARAEPWFDLAWLPDPTDPPGRWRLQMDFDIRPVLRRVRCPVLLIFGERDRWVPIEPSLEAWRSALGREAELTVARVAGAGHRPTLAVDRRDPAERGPIAPEYERLLVAWLRRRLGSAR